MDKRRAEVIDSPYFYVVFTLSHQLNPLLYCDQHFVWVAQNQFKLNEMIYTHEKLAHFFGECQRDNLNALWSVEELYIKNIERDRFVRILEDRLKPIYDSAKTQGYGICLAG